MDSLKNDRDPNQNMNEKNIADSTEKIKKKFNCIFAKKRVFLTKYESKDGKHLKDYYYPQIRCDRSPNKDTPKTSPNRLRGGRNIFCELSSKNMVRKKMENLVIIRPLIHSFSSNKSFLQMNKKTKLYTYFS